MLEQTNPLFNLSHLNLCQSITLMFKATQFMNKTWIIRFKCLYNYRINFSTTFHVNVLAGALSISATCCCIANRNRPTSLFSAVSSSSDRADVQLQGYPKTYSHQQVFSQQQGTDNISSLTVSVWLVLFLTFIVSSVVPQGCLYGEGKVVQPVSDGGFEPASYFTNPSASHSTGKTAE